MDWPLNQYPYLCRWFDQVKLRQSYKSGLADWEPEDQVNFFKLCCQTSQGNWHACI
jgi:hypothetical protein